MVQAKERSAMSNTSRRNSRRKFKMRSQSVARSYGISVDEAMHLEHMLEERERTCAEREDRKQIRRDLISMYGKRYMYADGNMESCLQALIFSDFKPNSMMGFTNR